MSETDAYPCAVYFQSPSAHLALKRLNMEPQNVCPSIIKKGLAPSRERLLGTVVCFWKANRTATHVLVPLQPAAQTSAQIMMILLLSDCTAGPNIPAWKQSFRTKERDLNSLQSNSSFILWPLPCIPLLLFQIVFQAALALCICLSEASLFSVFKPHSPLPV